MQAVVCCPSFDCQNTHWSVKLYSVVGLVALVAGAVLLAIALRGQQKMLPYAILSFTVTVLSLPAAYLVNKYYILKELDDVSQDIKETVEDIDAVTDDIQKENSELSKTVASLRTSVKERGIQVDELQKKLDAVEEKLAKMERDLPLVMDEIVSVNGLLEEVDITAEVERLKQVKGDVDRAEALEDKIQLLIATVKRGMQKIREFADRRRSFVGESNAVDATWDQNRAELQQNIESAEKVAAKIEELNRKMQELAKLAGEIKVARLLKKQQEELYNQLLTQEV